MNILKFVKTKFDRTTCISGIFCLSCIFEYLIVLTCKRKPVELF